MVASFEITHERQGIIWVVIVVIRCNLAADVFELRQFEIERILVDEYRDDPTVDQKGKHKHKMRKIRAELKSLVCFHEIVR